MKRNLVACPYQIIEKKYDIYINKNLMSDIPIKSSPNFNAVFENDLTLKIASYI